MKKYLTCILYLVVILNPYNSIDYDEPTLYLIDEVYQSAEIVEILGDGYGDQGEIRKAPESQGIVPSPYYLHALMGQYFPY